MLWGVLIVRCFNDFKNLHKSSDFKKGSPVDINFSKPINSVSPKELNKLLHFFQVFRKEKQLLRRKKCHSAIKPYSYSYTPFTTLFGESNSSDRKQTCFSFLPSTVLPWWLWSEWRRCRYFWPNPWVSWCLSWGVGKGRISDPQPKAPTCFKKMGNFVQGTLCRGWRHRRIANECVHWTNLHFLQTQQKYTKVVARKVIWSLGTWICTIGLSTNKMHR